MNQNSFQVFVEGVRVPLQNVTTDHPDQSAQGLGDYCDKMSWVGFDATFPVDEDVVIKVQYVMETMGRADTMQNIEYILETGAGWAGPIQRGYVIVKFPYVATAENVLAASTPGYQFLYNEVFWSFENLEPTSEDNIHVSIVSPDTWQRIVSLRRDLREHPQVPEKWLELADIYSGISTWHGTNIRNEAYRQKVVPTYEEAIAYNPSSATLYAHYAQFVHEDCCFVFGNPIDQADLTRVLNLVNKALALDPKDPIALQILDFLYSQSPGLQFTLPATIPPTATSQFTATPSVTPSVTMTPVPSEQNQPIVVTVIHTKLVKAPTPTRKPIPTRTSSPTETPVQEEPQNETGSSPILFGALTVFIAGMGVGAFWSRKIRK